MELVKAVASQGSATPQSVAIRAEQKNYTYLQLISSAWKISNLLTSANLRNVRFIVYAMNTKSLYVK